jgi:hypothetical protein
VLVGQTIGFLAGSYVLNHRAVYRPGGKQTVATKLVGSISPIADPGKHTFGAAMEIPFEH